MKCQKQWTPKPSVELCRLLEALKPRRNQKLPASMAERVAALEKRFLNKINKGDCWEWQGVIGHNGYGRFEVGGRNGILFRAHRFSWLFYRGEIPDGFVICHSCDNRKCANPDHLWIGTQTENMQDASRKGRMSIGAGHAKKISVGVRKAFATKPRKLKGQP